MNQQIQLADRTRVSLCLVSLVLACPFPAVAHQTLSIAIPQGEIGNAPPPMPGAAEFLRVGLPVMRPRCDAAASERLDKIEKLARDAKAVRWGAIPGVDRRIAENLRAMAEKELVSLLESLPEALSIDLASPNNSVERIRLDPHHGSLLIRVVDGGGPVNVRFVEWDLTTEDFDRDTQLPIPGGGVTHFLARLRGVPEDPTTIRFAIRRDAEATPAFNKAIELLTPPVGRLVISLLDESREPTHALLAIRSPRGGVYREPPGAVDLRGQLNDVVSQLMVNEPGKGYQFFLPGAKRGRYWVTPPETDMTLPSGEWELMALRGPEHTPVIQRVVVEPGCLTKAECVIRRWNDQPSKGWWSGDDHVHARLMSGADARRLLDYAAAVDLHVANILEMGDPLRTYYTQRGFGRDYRVRDGQRWLVPGQEDPRSDLGHVIGLNLRGQVRDVGRYLQNDLLAAEMHAGGGLYGHTHVGDNACFAHRQMALFTPMEIVDFTSIMQSALGVELYYEFLNLGFRLTASAGADTPYGGTMGAVRVYASTGRDTLADPDDWFDAVRAGKTFVTNGPMLEFSVDGYGPGELISADEGSRVEVVATATGDAGWSSPRRLSIVRLGEPVAVADSLDVGETRLAVETSVEVGEGCWIAATAIGHDGSQAHTTPVYVSIGDGWHGSRELAPKIARKQLRVLDEIEREVLVEAERKIAEGRRHPMDLQPLTNAAQADAVRNRIAIARQHYADLLQRLESSE